MVTMDFRMIFSVGVLLFHIRKVVIADCIINGVPLKDGDTFHRSCREECTCINNVYVCTSTCPHESIKPSLECEKLELLEIPGRCCKEWTCISNDVHQDPSDGVSCGGFLDSMWSECPVECGIGISTRVTRQNKDCWMSTEFRLCQLRPCPGNIDFLDNYEQLFSEKSCRITVKSPTAVHLHYMGCTSIYGYHLNFCGQCQNKCCQPYRFRNMKVKFQCPDNSTLIYDYLHIDECSCERC